MFSYCSSLPKTIKWFKELAVNISKTYCVHFVQVDNRFEDGFSTVKGRVYSNVDWRFPRYKRTSEKNIFFYLGSLPEKKLYDCPMYEKKTPSVLKNAERSLRCFVKIYNYILKVYSNVESRFTRYKETTEKNIFII